MKRVFDALLGVALFNMICKCICCPHRHGMVVLGEGGFRRSIMHVVVVAVVIAAVVVVCCSGSSCRALS